MRDRSSIEAGPVPAAGRSLRRTGFIRPQEQARFHKGTSPHGAPGFVVSALVT